MVIFTLNLYFHTKGKDEYLGRAIAQPLVKLNGAKPPASRLMWMPIMRGDRQCGELLASFELYLVSLPNPNFSLSVCRRVFL